MIKSEKRSALILLLYMVFICIPLLFGFFHLSLRQGDGTLENFKKHSAALKSDASEEYNLFITYDTARDFDPARTYDAQNRQTLRILFIGNSYTFSNNMPFIIKELAARDPDSNFNLEIGMFVEGSATLGLLLKRPNADKVLTQRNWDYVVLQPQSLWASAKERAPGVNKSLAKWSQKIRAAGAKPVFFMTWPRQTGKSWYNSESGKTLHNMKLFGCLQTPESMYNNLIAFSKFVSDEYHLILTPVGYYWTEARKNHPELEIYAPDGTHPSPEGSLLTALVFYKLLVNPQIKGLTDAPAYLDEAEKAAIFDILSAPLPAELKHPFIAEELFKDKSKSL